MNVKIELLLLLIELLIRYTTNILIKIYLICYSVCEKERKHMKTDMFNRLYWSTQHEQQSISESYDMFLYASVSVCLHRFI